MEKNYTYLLQCADGTLYCGWTNHLKERVEAHNAGKGAKYTKTRRPVTLVYYEEFATKQEAMRREWAVKQLSRLQKLELITAYQKKKNGGPEGPAILAEAMPQRRTSSHSDKSFRP